MTALDVIEGRARYAVICGDATAVLDALPEAVAAVCYCDPPYGLSAASTDDVIACLRAWLAGEVYAHRGGGFMGRSWDAYVPGPEAWRAVHRVLKPGGYCVAYSSTRTVDLLGMAIRLARFEMREGWAWAFGAGFPKSLDVSKAIDAAAGAEREVVGVRPNSKSCVPMNGGAYGSTHGREAPESFPITAPATPAAAPWEGYGTTTKPAVEPLVVARKALDGTVAHNVLTHGAGALNIDAARIGTESTVTHRNGNSGGNGARGRDERVGSWANPPGRFPAALALVHSEGCELVGQTRVKTGENGRPWIAGVGGNVATYGDATIREGQRYGDADGCETVDEWRCEEGCAVRELGRQSGELTSGSKVGGAYGRADGIHGGGHRGDGTSSFGDTGTAARFFYQAKASARDRLAYITCAAGCTHHETVAGVREARASARDVTQAHPHGLCRACGARRDHYQHSTVKPLDLARYHAALLSLPAHTRPVAIVPFCGTGAEARALLDAGFRVIAIDLDPRHCAMTEHRLAAAPSSRADAPAARPKPVAVATPRPAVAKRASGQLSLAL